MMISENLVDNDISVIKNIGFDSTELLYIYMAAFTYFC